MIDRFAKESVIFSQAISHFQKALELSPTHQKAQQGLEMAKKHAKTIGGFFKEGTSTVKTGIKKPFKKK